MFEKFNEKARRALFFARYEASKLGSRVIESEHVLLGILREGEESVLELLSRFDVKPKDLRRQIEGDRVFVERVSSTAELPLDDVTKKVLAGAAHEAEQMSHKTVDSEHLIIGLLKQEGSLGARVLMQAGLDLDRVRSEVVAIGKERKMAAQRKELPLLHRYGRDLTLLAEEGELPPFVGRQNEIDRLVRVMVMRTRRNPVLVGEPGVGKTAIVEGLAQLIAGGTTAPIYLREKRILALDVYNDKPDTWWAERKIRLRGRFLWSQVEAAESSFDPVTLERIFSELAGKSDVVLYVNDFHILLEVGMLAAGLLKQVLLRGELTLIGATTPRYVHLVERHQSLRSHLQIVRIEPPSAEETYEIVRGIKKPYEEFHGVRYPDSVLRHAVLRSERYVSGCQPEKTVTVMDAAGARVKEKGMNSDVAGKRPEVTERDVDEVIAASTGIEPESTE